MRRRRKSPFPILIIIGAALILGVFSVSTFGSSNNPEDLVLQFYKYEQDGDFGNAWELFHSEMKKRFDKSDYIQTKNHVFLGHMAVDTFDVEIGDSNEIGEWRLTKEGPAFQNVHQVEVTLTFESQFGLFNIQQNCYVVKEEGEWRVLWDYRF